MPSKRVLHQTVTMSQLSPGHSLDNYTDTGHTNTNIFRSGGIIRLIRISNSLTRNVGHGQFDILTNNHHKNIFSTDDWIPPAISIVYTNSQSST